MKPTIMDYIVCPFTKKPLTIVSFVELKRNDVIEIMDGMLYTSETLYPIINGVPRFYMSDSCKSIVIDYCKKYGKQIREHLKKENYAEIIFQHKNKEDDVVSNSFGRQWKKYVYGSKTWGAYPQERSKRLLCELGIKKTDLYNKDFLDAGCGSGDFHAYAVNDYGLNVFGVDICDSVEMAFKRNIYNSKIHYIQCSLLNMPFKIGLFDYAYSNGVIHHISNPYIGFKSIASTVKNGGMMYLWLYHKYNRTDKLLLLSRVISRMPEKLQTVFCTIAASLLFSKLHVKKFVSRSYLEMPRFNELVVMYMDALTPVYQSMHTQQDLQDWFISNGFNGIKLVQETFTPKGFGMHACKEE